MNERSKDADTSQKKNDADNSYCFDASNLTGVVDASYTTQKSNAATFDAAGVLASPEMLYGLCSPQRKHLLPGAQRAPRRKSAAAPSCAAWRTGSYYRRGRPQSHQETSVRRT